MSRDVTHFYRCFFKYLLIVRELILGLIGLICLSAIAIAFAEGRSFEESFYFAFITALSIGYGDIVPETSLGRLVSVMIGFVGILFAGLTVAVATRALADTMKHVSHRHHKDTVK